ncbi:MAG: ferrous iron transport protein B [Thermodesulfobacteriaceae bacterium]|nr:ferrous iron transport protein B [Thermodesulfobacteriaceae bacterium]MCX8042053.1 ferrous iron transport protein B [Thermodesulfobacteriaceae bacterium]MDW8136369.1 ferrous iron transport protein B [Thermodesulfobacterium sp.]
MKIIRAVLVGNPNVGKTSLLNHLAGSNLKIGNWPGVTVEKKEGKTYFQDFEILLIDLPGIYTLEELVSEDEKITFDFLYSKNYEVLLNIIETPRIERDLYLTTQLLDLEKPMILVLNMMDEAQKLGIEVDIKRLQDLLKIKVLSTNGRTGEGVKELLPAIVETYEQEIKPTKIRYETSEETKIKEKRLYFSQGLAKEVVKRKLLTKESFTEILDRFLIHPVWGNLFFLLIMYFTFKIAFDFSIPFSDWIEGFIQNFIGPLIFQIFIFLGAPSWVGDFFSSAVIGGVGTVLVFIPLIFSIYFLLTLLETSGYLPRVAFLMDRWTHKLGLHGLSVFPLVLALGCNVPALIATRTFQDRKDKFLVMTMIPFISCPARLVLFSFFATLFFSQPVWIIFFLYLLGLVFSILTSFLLRKTFLKRELSHFVMDLPPYRIPSLKIIFKIVWFHLQSFIYRAGTLIFLISIFIWLLLNLPPGIQKVEDSLAGKIGKTIGVIFSPIGLSDWRITTSLIPAFLAREAIISTMGVILLEEKTKEIKEIDLKEEAKTQILDLIKTFKEAFYGFFSLWPQSLSLNPEEAQGLKKEISKILTFKQALSFLIFLLIYNSCLATFVTMWKEGSKRLAFLFLGYSFALAWILAFIIYCLL